MTSVLQLEQTLEVGHSLAPAHVHMHPAWGNTRGQHVTSGEMAATSVGSFPNSSSMKTNNRGFGKRKDRSGYLVEYEWSHLKPHVTVSTFH